VIDCVLAPHSAGRISVQVVMKIVVKFRVSVVTSEGACITVNWRQERQRSGVLSRAIVYAQCLCIEHNLTAHTKSSRVRLGCRLRLSTWLLVTCSVRLVNPTGARAASAKMSSYVLLDDVSNPSFAYSVFNAIVEMFGWRRQVTLSSGRL
jgi:hypothetical protein